MCLGNKALKVESEAYSSVDIKMNLSMITPFSLGSTVPRQATLHVNNGLVYQRNLETFPRPKVTKYESSLRIKTLMKQFIIPTTVNR